MVQLPQEIVELILEELYQSDETASLESCCLTCWSFCGAAQPRLFRRVIVNIVLDTDEHWTSPFASLLSLLQHSPHLAPFIHHFGFKLYRWYSEAQHAPWLAEDEHLTLLLPLFTHLKRFGVYPFRTPAGTQLNLKWEYLSESAQNAIGRLIHGGNLMSLDLVGLMVIPRSILMKSRGLKELAMPYSSLPPAIYISESQQESSQPPRRKDVEPSSVSRSQLTTLVLNFRIRTGTSRMVELMEWVTTVFDCTQLRSLRLELPSPFYKSAEDSMSRYLFIQQFQHTLRTLDVDLGARDFARYNQLGYRIVEGTSTAPDWSSFSQLQSLTLKADAKTKFSLYDHIDWFTNPIMFVGQILSKMTGLSDASHWQKSAPATSAANLQSLHLSIKFIRFIPRLVAANNMYWATLFNLLLSPSLFPKLTHCQLVLTGLDEGEAKDLMQGHVMNAIEESHSLNSQPGQNRATGGRNRGQVRLGKVDFTLRFVEVPDVLRDGVVERLPRI